VGNVAGIVAGVVAGVVVTLVANPVVAGVWAYIGVATVEGVKVARHFPPAASSGKVRGTLRLALLACSGRFR
jgi:hypothetical protein